MVNEKVFCFTSIRTIPLFSAFINNKKPEKSSRYFKK